MVMIGRKYQIIDMDEVHQTYSQKGIILQQPNEYLNENDDEQHLNQLTNLSVWQGNH
jgi:hypothetical protein